ncbi:MAG: hypothetical protein M9898_14145 [Chitinophagaceae bacterium]|nr:hypothetical protein [Chitinophagaceae bacterium]
MVKYFAGAAGERWKVSYIFELPVIFMTIFRLTFLFTLFVSVNVANGQTSSDYLDTLVNNYTTDLRNKNIDTICIYQDYCVGCLYKWKKVKDRCNFSGLYIPTYIFWTDRGQTYMTKKDNCFDYSIIKIPSDSIWTYFFKNQDGIKNEELKIPQYIEMKNGKEEVYSSTIDHSRHQRLKLIVGQDTLIDKDLDDYYLTKQIGINGQTNLNYDYNINSQLKNFQLLIERTIKMTTKLNPLKKTRR